MKVAYDISPTKSASSVRGVGIYTENLLSELSANKSGIDIIPFQGNSIPDTDLVHYPYFDLFFHTLPIRKKSPTIVTIHDVIPLIFSNHFPSGVKGKLNLRLQILALKSTDAIITVSKRSKIDILEKLGVSNTKIHVVYNAPSKIFKPQNKKIANKIRVKYKLPEFFFLYVGDVNWNKNIITLLKAVKLTQINLVMVGKAIKDDSLVQVQQINKEIRNLGIDGKVFMTGFIPSQDLCSLYNLASATIVPSIYEGFGFPVVESMSCSTPVLCSSGSSLPELGGNAAIYFDPSSTENIVTELERFMKLNPVELKSVKKACLEQAQRFTWDKAAKETINIYKSVYQR